MLVRPAWLRAAYRRHSERIEEFREAKMRASWVLCAASFKTMSQNGEKRGFQGVNEPFPAGTRFLVGIIVEARTFQEAREQARRIVGEEGQVSHVFGRVSASTDASAVPQVIDPLEMIEDPLL